MTMIERVARAIDPHVWDGEHPSWSQLSDKALFLHHKRKQSRQRARAAIEAMREPNIGIVFTLDEAMHGDPGHNCLPTGQRLADVMEWWRSIIDAGLRDDRPLPVDAALAEEDRT